MRASNWLISPWRVGARWTPRDWQPRRRRWPEAISAWRCATYRAARIELRRDPAACARRARIGRGCLRGRRARRHGADRARAVEGTGLRRARRAAAATGRRERHGDPIAGRLPGGQEPVGQMSPCAARAAHGMPGHENALAAAREAVDGAERALAEESAEFRRTRERKEASVGDIRAALPEGTALVSFVRYGRRIPLPPRAAGAPPAAPPAPVPSYVAVVTSRTSPPVLVDGGPRHSIVSSPPGGTKRHAASRRPAARRDRRSARIGGQERPCARASGIRWPRT